MLLSQGDSKWVSCKWSFSLRPTLSVVWIITRFHSCPKCTTWWLLFLSFEQICFENRYLWLLLLLLPHVLGPWVVHLTWFIYSSSTERTLRLPYALESHIYLSHTLFSLPNLLVQAIQEVVVVYNRTSWHCPRFDDLCRFCYSFRLKRNCAVLWLILDYLRLLHNELLVITLLFLQVFLVYQVLI